MIENNKHSQYSIKDFILNDLCCGIREICKKYFRNKNIQIDIKNDKSLVSLADKEIEYFISSSIKKLFPNDGIFGEENDRINKNSEYQWVIDPIDGTLSFLSGRATFTTLITLDHNGETVFSLVYQPILDEKFYYYDGKSYLNGEEINVSNKEKITDCIIATTGTDYFSSTELEKFNSFTKNAKSIIYGGDAYLQCLLAIGMIDIVIEPNCMKFYDYRAPMDIIIGAGGFVSNWKGENMNKNPKNILHSDKFGMISSCTKINFD